MVLWRTVGLVACGWLYAAEPVRFAESIVMADVSAIKLPSSMTVASAAADLLAAPQEDAVAQRLRVGESLTALQFVEGPEQQRDCNANPFDGCVRRTTVWVRARTAAGKTGYCSLLHLRVPLGGKAIPQEIPVLFGYSKALQTKGLSDLAKYLPQASGVSFVDRVGLQNILAKVLTPAGELVASQRDLEFVVRQSNASFSYQGVAKSVPEEMDGLPRRMLFNPALAVLALYEDRAVLLTITHADIVGIAAMEGTAPREARPLLFRLHLPLKNAAAMALLASPAARRLRVEAIKVSTARYSYKMQGSTVTVKVTSVDLDGDGLPDLLRYLTSESVPNCNPRTDVCGSQRTAMLALHDGAWYATGRTWPGQDRLEGY